MGRLIVLCLIFLSVLSFPGNTSALITGEIWQNALNSAKNPALGPPSATADATFKVNGDINFSGNTPSLTFGQFLNSPLVWQSSSIDPDKPMFSNTRKDPDQGIFFRFTWSLDLPAGLSPVTITHDDGFYFFDVSGNSAGKNGVFEGPLVSTFPVMVKDPGGYLSTLYYGALNDTNTHVLIFSTPEPGSMLLLALGIIGIGVLRKRK